MIDLTEKKAKLENASIQLKKQFFGIDKIIDNIIDNIRAWYLFPELNNRPHIVCLMGLTGVGKTDLIRNLCSHLDISSNFAEIQMDGRSNSTETIKDILMHTTINPESHSVLLLDEIQRFKTKDEEGNDIRDGGMQDVWMLLSDGTLGNKNSLKSDLISQLMDVNYDIYRDDKKKNETKDDKDNEDPLNELVAEEDEEETMYSWSNQYRASKMYQIDNTTSKEEYMAMSLYEMRDKLVQLLSSADTFVPKPYRKMLIFISGNLDEAFHVATDASTSEIDADFIHEETSKVTVVDIKDALGKRFKPEQIARFGNNYVIYPSLNRQAYYGIIGRRLDNFVESANAYLKDAGFSLYVDKSIDDLIYNNGVYPAQGARPVISTIDNFINNIIPNVIIDCEENNYRGEVCISSTPSEGDFVVYRFGENERRIPFVGELDRIRKDEQVKKNNMAMVAVHESGHALVHSLVFGVAPKSAKIGLASSNMGGFVFSSVAPTTKEEFENSIKVSYAGRAAEELAFGSEFVSDGATSDYASVISKFVTMARKSGMYGDPVVVGDNINVSLTDGTLSDGEIRKHASRIYAETIGLLRDNIVVLKQMSKLLLEKRELTSKDIREFLLKHDIEVVADRESKDTLYPYDKKFQEWLDL